MVHRHADGHVQLPGNRQWVRVMRSLDKHVLLPLDQSRCGL